MTLPEGELQSGAIAEVDRSQIVRAMAGFKPRTLAGTSMQSASVALLIGPCEGTISFLLTQRSNSLRRHAGQFALPGGKIDSGETPTDTMIREVYEEVNLDIRRTDVLGRLDDYVTRSGFLICPLVVWSDDLLSAQPSPAEVASISYIPIATLVGRAVPTLTECAHDDRPLLQLPLGGDLIIYAPTGAILFQFARWCLAREYVPMTRFAEPKFAWT